MAVSCILIGNFCVAAGRIGGAGHGPLDTRALILAVSKADGLVGHGGDTDTIRRDGRAMPAPIEHDLPPLLIGQTPTDVEAQWRRIWNGPLNRAVLGRIGP